LAVEVVGTVNEGIDACKGASDWRLSQHELNAVGAGQLGWITHQRDDLAMVPAQEIRDSASHVASGSRDSNAHTHSPVVELCASGRLIELGSLGADPVGIGHHGKRNSGCGNGR
jgi:hypothetical protein